LQEGRRGVSLEKANFIGHLAPKHTTDSIAQGGQSSHHGLKGMITSVFHQGSVILVWDGSRHVDINLFAFDQRQALADSFLDDFVEFTEGRLKLALRDDQPRGIGRVVSFASEIEENNIQAARQQREENPATH
jgi:hypothetical protein